MFLDRAIQFRDGRAGRVAVNDAGEERDEYDALNPLYVVWERADGTMGGSMRFSADHGPDHGERAFQGPHRRRQHREPRNLGMHPVSALRRGQGRASPLR